MLGFDPTHYNLTPKEAGLAAVVNEAVEAIADGFDFSEDAAPLTKAAIAVATEVAHIGLKKEGILLLGIKLFLANLMDELAEKEAAIAELQRRVVK